MFALAPVLLAALVRAAPAPAPVTDTSIMQYALSLEHIEHTFYVRGLEQFDDLAFLEAGYPPWVRGRFAQIRDHEADHVAFLTGQLGAQAVQPCNYSYPYTDVHSWAALSQTLEGVGAAAYMGAARYVDSKDVLESALSISHVEARQAGWVDSAVLKHQPWDGPYEPALAFSGAWSLAVGFIVPGSCPSSNPALPVQTFPALTVSDTAAPPAGSTIRVSYDASAAPPVPGATYMAWYSGMNVTYTPVAETGAGGTLNGTLNGTTTVPAGLRGTVYAGVVSNASALPATDATMVSGLAVFSFPFGSRARAGA
ncbi:hypothetical protein AcV5_009625 [Taiwanofungus camphoratus]|nr:hypothetical protein AcV5_009625 [Antrodia cinnamomea]